MPTPPKPSSDAPPLSASKSEKRDRFQLGEKRSFEEIETQIVSPPGRKGRPPVKVAEKEGEDAESELSDLPPSPAPQKKRARKVCLFLETLAL